MYRCVTIVLYSYLLSFHNERSQILVFRLKIELCDEFGMPENVTSWRALFNIKKRNQEQIIIQLKAYKCGCCLDVSKYY